MEKRLLLLWIVIALIWILWIRLMQAKYAPEGDVAQPAIEKAAEAGGGQPPAITNRELPAGQAALPAEPAADAEVPLREDLALGADAPGDNADFPIFARLSNRGAAVKYLQLNRYENEQRDGPLVLVPDDPRGEPAFRFKLDDNLDIKHWNVVEATPQSVVFRTTARQGKLEVEKRFALQANTDVIELSIAIRNASAEPMTDLVYTLTGGNGIPIEGEWYTRYYRNLVVAHVPATGSAPYLAEEPSSTVVSNEEKGKPSEYLEPPIQFAGVVSQYFASLVVQNSSPLQERRIAAAAPYSIGTNATAEATNVGVRLRSTPITLAAGAQVCHDYLLYNGPKEKQHLAGLADYHVPLIIHYPDFLMIPIGAIARFMVGILDFFYGIVRDYGIAIMLLTVLVRGCMFPLTFRQTKSIQRMQAMQPHIEELKAKHGKDKEKLNRALMDLYAKHNVNPLAGCLPIFLQLPIFVGLWQSLYNSFSLRQSSFLYGLTWIDDLAAPDQLFPFGMSLPLLGPYFNLLPILAIAQMVVQMRLSTPQARTPEQAMQQKMMTFMMVFMGFLFYKVPAGLCVYIITSGLWSMMERKLLPKAKTTPAAAVGTAPATAVATGPTDGNVSWKSPISAAKKKSRR